MLFFFKFLSQVTVLGGHSPLSEVRPLKLSDLAHEMISFAGLPVSVKLFRSIAFVIPSAATTRYASTGHPYSFNFKIYSCTVESIFLLSSNFLPLFTGCNSVTAWSSSLYLLRLHSTSYAFLKLRAVLSLMSIPVFLL